MEPETKEENVTSTDVNWFSRNSSNSSTTNSRFAESGDPGQLFSSENRIQYVMDGDYYDMSGKKYLIIFNHYKYQSTKYYNYQKYSPREGTFNDVKSLGETFENLGFEVTSHTDLEYDKITDKVADLCKANHSATSCVAIVILSHGERGGQVCAADRPYELRDLITMLQHAPSLAGKPKLMFIQACRGKKVDGGSRVRVDGDGGTIVIPTHADCLIVYSSIEEHLSYRDRDGSWLIQALCMVVDENHEALDLLQIMTLVNRSVAFRETNVPTNRDLHLKKQMPETRFTLTKLLKF